MKGEYRNTPPVWNDLLEYLHLKIQQKLTKKLLYLFYSTSSTIHHTPYIVYSILISYPSN